MQEELELKSILIVREFFDIILKNLLRLPSNREIEFSIDLVPSAGLIFQSLYRMAL